MFTVYILRCNDGTLYVGCTSDLNRRVAQHASGRGANYTAQRLPAALIYAERFKSIVEAEERERQVKRWTTAKKEALVAGDTKALRRHAVRRVYDRKKRLA